MVQTLGPDRSGPRSEMQSSLEAVLEQAGPFGPAQRRVFGLLCLLSLPFTGIYVGVVFQGFSPEHRCRDAAAERRAAECGWSPEGDERRRVWLPPDNLPGEPGGCRRYQVDWNQTDCHLLSVQLNQTPTTSCQEGWEYEYQGRTSIVTEFHLVCSDSWLLDLFQSSLIVGFFISSFVFGYFADRFGRRLSIFVSNVMAVVAAIGLAVAPNYPTILVFRLLLGFSIKGGWMAGFVLLTEMVGVSYRQTVAIIYQMFFSIGLLILPLLAFLIPDWRWLHLATTAPYVLFLSYYWLLPESPRWLFSQNKMSEALELIKAIAKENKRKLCDVSQIQCHGEGKSSSGSLLDLIRTPNMRKNTLILMFNWFTSAVVYQGLIMRLGIVGGNVYIDFLIAALVEFPAVVLILVTIERFGRRLPFAAANIVAGASCFITAFIPDTMSWFKTVVACIGRLGITMTFEMVVFVNAELYPTFMRNLGVSVCSTMCEIGGIVSPFLLYRLAYIWLELPLIIFGVVALLAGGLVLLLPETKGRPLPETIDDIEFPDRKRLSDCENQPMTKPLKSAPTDEDETAV